MNNDDDSNIILLVNNTTGAKSSAHSDKEKRPDDSAEQKSAAQEAAALARKQVKSAFRNLKRIMENESCDPNARVAAAAIILDRAYGKPQQPIHHTHGLPA